MSQPVSKLNPYQPKTANFWQQKNAMQRAMQCAMAFYLPDCLPIRSPYIFATCHHRVARFICSKQTNRANHRPQRHASIIRLLPLADCTCWMQSNQAKWSKRTKLSSKSRYNLQVVTENGHENGCKTSPFWTIVIVVIIIIMASNGGWKMVKIIWFQLVSNCHHIEQQHRPVCMPRL